jgi:NADPH-dependent curcumin reductase CurA
MANDVNRRLLLRKRPSGLVGEDVFELVEEPKPSAGEGQAVVRNLYLSLDPTNRVWMSQDSYLPKVEIGAVMRGTGIGEVVESNADGYSAGDLVTGLLGWQDYAVIGGGDAIPAIPLPRDTGAPPEVMIGALGVTGFTAYYGVEKIGEPTEGETMVVSAAAGAVGSVAGQLGKIRGARVVGIAGTDEKCSWLVDELGFDAAVNRRDGDWREQLARACPNGVDVDFENVGGEIMDEVFGMLNLNARVVLCGLISSYNEEAPPPGPRNFPVLLMNRVRLQGFIIIDHFDIYPEAVAKLGQLLAEGKLKHRDTVVEGLENAPRALNMLFEGENVGKLIVKVAYS